MDSIGTVEAIEDVLVRASRDGDRSAFGRLYTRYSRMVHAIVLARVPPAEADDLVQDVFVSALRQLHALRDERAFGGWLAAIARNCANGWHRGSVELVEMPELSAESRQEAEHESRRALAAIRVLPEAYRETLMMRLVEGMTGPEIAARTGLTADSVRVNLHRGMKLLREALEKGERVNDDYLWDRSGDPDPDIQRLESLLGRYRHEAPLRARRPWRFAVAMAAALIVLVAGGVFGFRFLWPAGEAWPVATVSGAPTIDGRRIEGEARLEVGEELRTDARSRARVQIARVGELDVEPNSRVTLVATSAGRHRLQLDEGKIAARVWAPPFTFSVRTPAGLASDIGCAFTLQYGGDAGQVRVTSGWVDFDGEDRSALIPGGAMTELRDDNPGSPFYTDATPAFRAALHAYDFQDGALTPVIDEARPRDAMTLLHLLERVPSSDRAVLFDALTKLAPPPPAVTRDGILDRDLQMLNAWRQSLGLGGVKKWWLHWRDAL